MPMHVANLVIGNTVIDLSNTTPEQVIYDRSHPAPIQPKIQPEIMPLPQQIINKQKVLEHLKMAREGPSPHLKSYLGDMTTPTLHFKKGYKLKDLEKLHKKSSYVSQFLKE